MPVAVSSRRFQVLFEQKPPAPYVFPSVPRMSWISHVYHLQAFGCDLPLLCPVRLWVYCDPVKHFCHVERWTLRILDLCSRRHFAEDLYSHDELSYGLVHDAHSSVLVHDEDSCVCVHDVSLDVLGHDVFWDVLVRDVRQDVLVHDEFWDVLVHDERWFAHVHDVRQDALVHDEFLDVLVRDEILPALVHGELWTVRVKTAFELPKAF